MSGFREPLSCVAKIGTVVDRMLVNLTGIRRALGWRETLEIGLSYPESQPIKSLVCLMAIESSRFDVGRPWTHSAGCAWNEQNRMTEENAGNVEWRYQRGRLNSLGG